MNFFENEIMRRVKELDCSAVYRERDNGISVMYDGVKIAEISCETAEKISGITDEESEKFRLNPQSRGKSSGIMI